MSTPHGPKQLYSSRGDIVRGLGTGQKWKPRESGAGPAPVLTSFGKLKPVFNVEEGGVILVIVVLVERGHLHALRRGGYDVIFTSFPDPSS